MTRRGEGGNICGGKEEVLGTMVLVLGRCNGRLGNFSCLGGNFGGEAPVAEPDDVI